ncbi:hypothetical protein AGLY_006108 [Aphis glycines]|uniref:Uncharacterized protein n=1 Tax=Aphis glycines TaxID=307491 RepID=A0A6G0TV55_APHGL|nr:hypothetical protein AGLY_006108 [Aphis glycines]
MLSASGFSSLSRPETTMGDSYNSENVGHGYIMILYRLQAIILNTHFLDTLYQIFMLNTYTYTFSITIQDAKIFLRTINWMLYVWNIIHEFAISITTGITTMLFYIFTYSCTTIGSYPLASCDSPCHTYLSQRPHPISCYVNISFILVSTVIIKKCFMKQFQEINKIELFKITVMDIHFLSSFNVWKIVTHSKE